MNPLKELCKALVVASVVTVLVFSTNPAMAAETVPVNTPFGSCVGGVGSDCVTATSHASVSVVSTLSVNEERALSFGDISVSCGAGPCTGTATLTLSLTGVRVAATTGVDVITPLHGAQSSNGAGAAASGGQAPAHFTISGGNENAAQQVYISFADNAGNPIDISGDSYHPGNKVTLVGPAGHSFTVDTFVINEDGSDVYGHYIATGGVTGGHQGITNPFNPAGHVAFAAGTAGVADVVVGATLHTVAGAGVSYAAGKYSGTYDTMVSY